MKNLLIIFVFISSAIFAQESAFTQYVHAGINGTQVSGDALTGFDKAGITAGFGVKRAFKPNLTYDISINYSQKGSRMPLDSIMRQIYLMRLHYFEVPFVLHWAFKPNIDLNVGLAFARLIAFSEIDANGDLPIVNPFEKNEYSFLFGVNYYLSEKIGVTFNLLNSLRPIRKNPGGAVAPAGLVWRQNDGQYNTVLGLSINLKIK